MERRRRRWWFGLALAAILLIGAGIAFAMSSRASSRAAAQARDAAPPPVPVVTAPAHATDVNVYLGGLGSVTPLQTVTVKTRVDGELTSVLFREGQLVPRGQLLAQIDPRPFQAQLEQARGQMARDQAQLENARRDLERYRALVSSGFIAAQQVDTQAALVRQLEGVITADQGVIDTAKVQLAYCGITAPLAGRVGLRQVDAGNIVHASDPNGIVVITQLQPIAVLFTIPEDALPPVLQKLSRGERLAVDAYDRELRQKLATGSLLTVDNQIDPATGTVRLKAEFPNADFALFPNQFVNARLLVDVHRGATVVPTAAIQRGARGSFVYVVEPDHTAAARPVKVGVMEGDEVAVDEGLAPGEQVVVDGADRLREGATVVAQAMPAPSAAPAPTAASAAPAPSAAQSAGTPSHEAPQPAAAPRPERPVARPSPADRRAQSGGP
jgi:membrane fusion protein, multidrug efflux system